MVTPTELRADLYRFLDEVLETGVPLEVRRGDRVLRIAPVRPSSWLDRLVERPDVVTGDPGDLPQLHWSPSGEAIEPGARST